MDLKILFKLAEHIDFLDVIDLDEDHEAYITRGGRYAWVYQVGHFVCSIVVGLLEKADRDRQLRPPQPMAMPMAADVAE